MHSGVNCVHEELFFFPVELLLSFCAFLRPKLSTLVSSSLHLSHKLKFCFLTRAHLEERLNRSSRCSQIHGAKIIVVDHYKHSCRPSFLNSCGLLSHTHKIPHFHKSLIAVLITLEVITSTLNSKLWWEIPSQVLHRNQKCRSSLPLVCWNPMRLTS